MQFVVDSHGQSVLRIEDQALRAGMVEVHANRIERLDAQAVLGAGDQIRTGDPLVGNEMLYH